MNKPDASLHDLRPEYLRSLLAEAGLTQRAAAERIDVPERSMRYYLTDPASGKRADRAPYLVQYALEMLHEHGTTYLCLPGCSIRVSES